ncbi:MAG: 50S ribosomal protein L6 [Actinomycetales bacterium]|nr:50S ribosomal protein L6 [Actinomycetales bacterium]
MSRIGRAPVPIPTGVDVTIDGTDVTVRGPRGTLAANFSPTLTITRDDSGAVIVSRPDDERLNRSLHGLTRTLIANMVTGVTEGYRKVLEISGTGYRVAQKGSDLEFSLGFSHPVPVTAPAGIEFIVESPTRLVVAGADKQQVGQVAANLRALRKPDPYKAKGVRYEGERIRRKAGKAGKR